MIILGIETSCDETAISLVEDGTKILSNTVSSSLLLHSKTGGIIPEIAAREQVESIIPILDKTLEKGLGGWRAERSLTGPAGFDAIAVTYGPGLVGSLLVGLEVAKSLAYVWNKPLIPVNHLLGHLYSAWLERSEQPKFPLIALIVSGGHTELFLMKNHGQFRHLGGTRDDAAGEAFDKVSRLLGLGYPGGPQIQNSAIKGNPKQFDLPRPLIGSPDYDFSFSGLKTAVVNLIGKRGDEPKKAIPDIAASFQEAVTEVLVFKTKKAVSEFGAKSVALGGGVAANKRLREEAGEAFGEKLYVSSSEFSTDNAAMIASAAYFLQKNKSSYFNFKPKSWREVKAEPALLI